MGCACDETCTLGVRAIGSGADKKRIKSKGFDRVSPMDIFQLITISLIQGITEFLPISSSGHLVLVPALTSWDDQGQLIDVAAHFGTLGAVMIYLLPEIGRMIRGTFTLGKADRHGFMMAMMLVIASLPVILVGFIIEMIDPAFLRLTITVALANLIFAGWLYHADRTAPDSRTITEMQFKDAFKIGLAQILALIPGTSRSGVTMTMARQCGFSRLEAARFSMLMSVPVILGATLLKSRHFFEGDADASLTAAALVTALSCITAFLAIRFMMGWLARADFKIFVYYRIGLGILLLGALAGGLI